MGLLLSLIRTPSKLTPPLLHLRKIQPVAFLAQNYVLLGRLAFALSPAVSDPCLLMPRRGLTWTFLLSDIVTFCCQTAGTVFVILGGEWNRLGQIVRVFESPVNPRGRGRRWELISICFLETAFGGGSHPRSSLLCRFHRDSRCLCSAIVSASFRALASSSASVTRSQY